MNHYKHLHPISQPGDREGQTALLVVDDEDDDGLYISRFTVILFKDGQWREEESDLPVIDDMLSKHYWMPEKALLQFFTNGQLPPSRPENNEY